MSASSAPAMGALAAQLVQALERYQHDFDEMIESWMDRQHYHTVSRELDQIRMMKGALPQLSEAMADVLMRHVELTHSVWNAQIHPSTEATGDMRRLRTRHRDAVDAMRLRCLALYAARAESGARGASGCDTA